MLIQDMLAKYPEKQWGFLVFTNMAYVVTPITTDIQNILNFLPVISPQILPSKGYNLNLALNKAKELLRQSGFESGQLLIISSKPAEKNDLKLPDFIDIAWINAAPMIEQSFPTDYPQFNIRQTKAIDAWLKRPKLHAKKLQSSKNSVIQYHDEGRWFLAFALIPLALVFRKGWLIQLWG